MIEFIAICFVLYIIFNPNLDIFKTGDKYKVLLWYNSPTKGGRKYIVLIGGE